MAFSPIAGRVIERLQPLMSEGARRRRPARLALLENALAFAARGHTAGEAMLIERLATVGEGELSRAIADLPPEPVRTESVALRLTGVVLFESSRE